jgi:type VI secretion system protein ImpM
MSTAAADDSRPAPPGWFGKIPALGDFVARRLPPQFIEAWDHWLSTEILATRQKLGTEWTPSYLKAPTWCFALTPGVIDASYWSGVLTPSVDRVGRHFPLTLAAGGKAPPAETKGWWDTLIAAAMRARTPDCDADALDAALIGTPEQQDARRVQGNGECALTAALEGAGHGDSLWAPWQPESGRFGPVLAFRGLPQGPDFLKLIVP